MKKIAFIGRGHNGSLFPLIKRFLLDGYEVDYYCLHTEPLLQLEAADLKYESANYGFECIPSSCYPLLSAYFDSKHLRIFSIRTPRPFENNVLTYNIAMLYRRIFISKFCNYVNSQGYDCVNVIGRYNMTDLIGYLKRIKGNVVVSLHEVCNHFNADFKHPTQLIKYLIRNKTRIFVYSQKSYQDIAKYECINLENVKVIPFGKFETYKYMIDRSKLNFPERYILFIGYLEAYKGLDIFYRATSSLDACGVKYVVAGAGKSECLEKMKNDDRYVVINKYLSNYEFADLIKNAEFILCPYKSGSQSGIPLCSYVFNTPIIASDLQMFRDLIDDDENGILFNLDDELSLRKKLTEVLSNPDAALKFRSNLGKFESMHKQFDWSNIFNTFKSQVNLHG